MRIVSLSEFRAHASEMLDLVEQGETVRILRHGKPVAELVPAVAAGAAEPPAWKRPVEPIRYLRRPQRSGAELIVELRQEGAT
ncbi:type II toxin-antitoxin system Phd/YefM family antitoxin [Ramlibacter sp. AN1015]|uniref:type II toxin-antitoxin system Phd/YefM family antitoxin n=1 Tax=Ramlibacter sp. AN1015 TaxID=3133428 RepID=UPI0030BC0CEB